MKKLCIIITFIVILSSLPMTFAEKYTLNERDVTNLIDEYFSVRQGSFFNLYSNSVQNSKIFLNASDTVLKDEKNRELKLKAVEDKLKVKIVEAKTSVYIERINSVGEDIYLDVYEWVFFDYVGESGYIDTAGYGTYHIIKVGSVGETLVILEDSYDEGPLTEVTSSTYESVLVVTDISESNDILESNEMTLSVEEKILPRGEIISITYNRNAVANYADSWVYNGSSGGYNPSYKNFNSSGGDCTNYVSQCISQSLPQLKKTTHSTTNPAWWYENNGTSSVSDDYTTSSWIGADAQKTALKVYYGSEKVAPTNSDIIKGNPIYVDWHYSSGTPDYNHSYICVGTNSSGVPIINSHNTDYYHIPWKYGYSDSYYSTVKIYDNITIYSSQL